MRIATACITVCLALGLCLAAVAADGVPAPPAPPAGVGAPAPPATGGPPRVAPSAAPGAPGMPGGMEKRVRSMPVGPTDAMGAPRRVRGSILVTAVLPTNAKIVSVELFRDDALLGKRSQTPYQAELNSESVADGSHMLKAVGFDADGKQVWTATTKIDVQNAKQSPSSPTSPGGPAQSPKPAANKPDKVTAPAVNAKPDTPGMSSAGALGGVYSSAKHGFSVRYPADWTTKDLTSAIKLAKPGSVWVQFAAGKAASKLVINIRRSRLSPGTDAEIFAKFNPYVAAWERRTVLGSSAFATTTDESPKQVIHRLIVVKDGYAWMLNCIDTGATAGAAGRKLFDSVVESLAFTSAPAKGVTVKEIKKP